MAHVSLSLADLQKRLAATKPAKATAAFDAPPVSACFTDDKNGAVELKLDARQFSTGGLGWYGAQKGTLNGVPVRVQVTITIPGTKPEKIDIG